MADIIDLRPFSELPDPEDMDRAQLLEYLETVQGWIAQLDEEEPEDMFSEAYDDWGDRHEELEDLLDDIRDLLDDEKGSRS